MTRTIIAFSIASPGDPQTIIGGNTPAGSTSRIPLAQLRMGMLPGHSVPGIGPRSLQEGRKRAPSFSQGAQLDASLDASLDARSKKQSGPCVAQPGAASAWANERDRSGYPIEGIETTERAVSRMNHANFHLLVRFQLCAAFGTSVYLAVHGYWSCGTQTRS